MKMFIKAKVFIYMFPTTIQNLFYFTKSKFCLIVKLHNIQILGVFFEFNHDYKFAFLP